MSQQDQRFIQLKRQYILADHHYRIGKIERHQFNAVKLEVISGLMEHFDDHEPYLTDFREQAYNEFIEANKLNYLKQKTQS